MTEPNTRLVQLNELFMKAADKRLRLHRAKINQHYTVDSENAQVIGTLLMYMDGMKEFEVTGMNLHKGICLMGNYGSGKTMLMQILRDMNFTENKYGTVPCRKVAQVFTHEGYEKIRVWGADSKAPILFDDLGAEPPSSYYGNKGDILGELIYDRYELYLQEGIRTHFTTNMDREEIKARYGERIISRLHEMCNFVVLGGSLNAKDRRI